MANNKVAERASCGIGLFFASANYWSGWNQSCKLLRRKEEERGPMFSQSHRAEMGSTLTGPRVEIKFSAHPLAGVLTVTVHAHGYVI